MVKQIFVNLPVKDLQKSVNFFTELGFSFNPDFTDEKGACMVMGENIYAMLLVEKFFNTFTPKEIANTSSTVEVINAISLESRDKVDEVTSKAVTAGGKISKQPQDIGWMYSQSVEDIDGHLWEFMFADESKRDKK